MYNSIRSILTAVFLIVIAAAPVPAQTSDITVAWDPNDPSEQVIEYRLYYKTGTSGPPYNGTGLNPEGSPIIIRVADLADQDNPRYSLTGLTAGVTYRFATTASNTSESRYSNEVSYSFQEPVELDHVEIQAPSPIVPENNTAQFTLLAYFNNDISSQVNATLWEVNCTDDASISSNGLLTTGDVTIDTPCTISATYTSGGITRFNGTDITIENTSVVMLDHIEIEGPDSVDENSSTNYDCIAHYTDGSNEYVTAESWSEDCPQTNISVSGLLNTGELDNNTQCNISARYLSQSKEIGIDIRNKTLAPTLSQVIIEGLDSVDESTSTNYACRAYYSDGSDRIVAPDSWTITTGASFAKISDQGTLNAYEVNTDETVGVMASHAEGQLARSHEIQVTVKDKEEILPASPKEVIIDNGDPGTSYTGKWKTYYRDYTSFGSPSAYCPIRKRGTYTFSTHLNGNYQVSFRWISRKGRNKNVKVEIFDGDTLVDIVTVNQTQNADKWNPLGTYTSNGPFRVNVVAKKWEPAVSVDGMKFSRQ